MIRGAIARTVLSLGSAVLLSLQASAQTRSEAPSKTPSQTPFRARTKTSAQTKAPWIIGPFTKPAVNPIIAPRASSTFKSPMGEREVRWEEFATFNPAAVVRSGKVFLLYRAEDATGESIVGGHTSRLGLAESDDGLRFTRQAAPVRAGPLASRPCRAAVRARCAWPRAGRPGAAGR